MATFIVATDMNADSDIGTILWANAAGRTALRPDPRSELLWDVVDTEAKNAIRSSLLTPTDPAADPADRLETLGHSLHLNHRTDGTAIVQVATNATDGISRVLEQQQLFRSALLELSELASTTENDDAFYQRLIERAVDVVPGAQAGSVQLHIAGTEQFRFVAAVGFDLPRLQEHVLDQADFFRDAWDPRAQIVREFKNEARSPEIAEWLATVGRLSELVVNVSAPVVVDGFPVAFLALDNFEDPDAMTETSVEMTTVLSRLIGDLWRRRDLEAKLRTEREAFRHQAMHDPLTALPNRRSLERVLDQAASSDRRRDFQRSVLFVDIDEFKGVNDRLGHEVGDLLLIAVSNALTKIVRGRDIVGRWGGDEFLILPYGLESGTEAMALAQRVLNHFETALQLAEDLEFRARLTIGVGWCETSSTDSNLLVHCADEALYEAKKAGKGTVRLRTVGDS